MKVTVSTRCPTACIAIYSFTSSFAQSSSSSKCGNLLLLLGVPGMLWYPSPLLAAIMPAAHSKAARIISVPHDIWESTNAEETLVPGGKTPELCNDLRMYASVMIWHMAEAR